MQQETKNLMDKMAVDWTTFNDKVAGYPIPPGPTLLSPERAKFRRDFMQEEIDEFDQSTTLEDAVDACIDLMYVTMGTLGEMGVLIQPTWDEVQLANMAKKRGERPKRPGAQGFDTIKPEGWTAPDHTDYMTITSADVQTILDLRSGKLKLENSISLLDRAKQVCQALNPIPSLPRLVVMGYAEHGKDTVCEILRDSYGFAFTSSSQFCAEHVILPAFEALGLPSPYNSAQECFDDRKNHRAFWYNQITNYNQPDGSRLGREIFVQNNVYCGIRNAREFHALHNTGTFDFAIWVDATGRGLPIEMADSCTVEQWMADYTLDNNGTLDDLRFNIDQLMGLFGLEKKVQA